MNPLRNYIAKYKGKFPVSVIWGSGVSINFLTPNAHAPFLNFAVNSSIMKFPFWHRGNPNNRVFMAIDTDAMHWNWFRDAMNYRCCKLLRRYAFSRAKRKKPYFPNGAYKGDDSWYFDMRSESSSIVNMKKLSTVPCSSVVPMAIDISMKLGVKLIALAGVEHGVTGGLTHFWQEWHPQRRPIQNKKGEISKKPKDLTNQRRVWEKNNYIFKKFYTEAKKRDTKIVRLTEKSTLSFIPYMKESDFLKYAKKQKGTWRSLKKQ